MKRFLSWIVPIFLLFWAWGLVRAGNLLPLGEGFDIKSGDVAQGIGILLALLAGIFQVCLSSPQTDQD